MSDDFIAGGFPGGGRELGDAIDGPVAEFGEDICEIGEQIDVQAAAGLDEGGDGRDFGTGLLAAQMEPVFAPKASGRIAPSHQLLSISTAPSCK